MFLEVIYNFIFGRVYMTEQDLKGFQSPRLRNKSQILQIHDNLMTV